MSKRGWLTFVVVQFLGAWVPTFANVHMNIAPIFAGVLLLPGILIAFFFPKVDITGWPLVFIIAINAVTWQLLATRFRKDADPSFKPEV